MPPPRPSFRSARFAAGITVSIGLLLLLGARFNPLPGSPGPLAPGILAVAVGLGLAGASLWLLNRGSGEGTRRAAAACAALAAAVALAAVAGWRAQVSLVTCGSLGCGSLALLALHGRGRNAQALSGGLALATATAALVTLLDGLLRFSGLRSPYENILFSGLPPAAGLLALSLGVLLVQPERDFLRVFLGERKANRRARQLLVATLVALPALEVLRVELISRGLLAVRPGVALFTGLEIALFLMAVALIARASEAPALDGNGLPLSRDDMARLQTQTATLQQEVAMRTRELQMANSNLRVVAKVNALLALTTQHTPNGVIIADAQTSVLWANPVWERLSGWNQAKSAGQRVDQLLGGIWGPAAEARAREILRSGQPGSLEVSGPGPDGRTRWLRITFQPVRDPEQSLTNFITILDDFTAYREADQRLQTANDRLQFALRSSGYGIWETHFPSNRMNWDEHMFEIYGVSPDDFGWHSDDWMRLIHPEDADAVTAHRQRVMDGTEKAFDIDFRIIRPDGRVHYVEAHGFLVRDETGHPVRMVGLNRDITAEQEMRETLRVTEERLGLALLATNEGVWDWNVSSGKIFRDHRWAELFDAGPEELGDIADWSSRVHPEDFPAAQAALDAHLQGRTPMYVAEYRWRTRPGAWLWTLDRGKVVSRDKEGRPLRMVGTQGDITARKKLEERLRHSEEISIQVSRLAQIGAWEWSLDTQTLTWAPELYRICEVELGYAPTLSSMQDFFPVEHRDAFMRAIEQATRGGRAFDLRAPFLTMRGRRLWVRVIGRAEFKDDRAVRLFGAVQDITSQHEAEESQRKLETQLFQVQKMETLGTLAGGIAHDFNNLLTGIMGYQDLSLDTLAPGHPSRSCLDEARNACLRARELVEQILTFSRQTEGGERVPVDMSFVVEEARRFLRATVPATIQIEVEIADNLGRVLADPTQLHQVLLNLGTNAAHAMRSTGGTLKLCVQTVVMTPAQAAIHGNLPAGTYLCLSVADTGHGMDAETQKRIFDPFFTTKDVGEGTGLGLSVVHGIMRAHGGAIEVTSSPGQGSTFDLYFPVAEVQEEAPSAPAAPMPLGRGEMVCVVDDEQIVAHVTRLSLERFGYRTMVFTSPEKCFEALKADHAECAALLSDQTMPGMTGLELSARVREFAPGLPIVIMSGYFSKISPRSLESLGNINLLAKPFTMHELARVIHRALHPEAALAG
ncbi:MAG TPA: PAS domain-containing protein [Opitutaceae bacterium]|nr:PAS domain-containing protein [Opitutaceae bacterium]